MNICVWNIGSSTALKFELIQLTSESLMAHGQIQPFEEIRAKGKIRRIGSRSPYLSFSCLSEEFEIPGQRASAAVDIAAGVNLLLEQLLDSQTIGSLAELDACAFKTVHIQGAEEMPGTVELTPEMLERMRLYNGVAPAHNPPYLELIEACQAQMQGVLMVGAFEFEFHRTLPPQAYLYSVPDEWRRKWGIRRYGFHGASHQYISERVAELYPNRDDLKLINVHLGGSSSLCAIHNGKSLDTSMGFSPQGTIPNATRNGDFDIFAGLWLMEHAGVTPDGLRDQLCNQGGLAGLSGIAGGNLPKIQQEAANGNTRCQQTMELFAYQLRKTIGGYAAALGGLDALTFTGGIGEYETPLRQQVCEGLRFLGIQIDPHRNKTYSEARISVDNSGVDVWVIPTHEEIIVARRALKYAMSCR
jgi:acetate kinase